MDNCNKQGEQTNSAASASMSIDTLADIISLLAIDTTSTDSEVQATSQPFSMRGYVADSKRTNPKACNPFSRDTDRIWEQLSSVAGTVLPRAVRGQGSVRRRKAEKTKRCPPACLTNMNPAIHNVAHHENIYMIRSEELKFAGEDLKMPKRKSRKRRRGTN